MKDLYFDRFNMQFTTEREPVSPPERYVRYKSDNGSGELSDTHFVPDGEPVTFTYTEEESKDITLLERKRADFFDRCGYSDYYTTEMVIPHEHYVRLLSQLGFTEEDE